MLTAPRMIEVDTKRTDRIGENMIASLHGEQFWVTQQPMYR